MTNQQMHDLEIAAYNQQSIMSLVRTIDLSQSHFSMIFIHCDYKILEQKIMQQFQDVSPFKILTILLAPTITTLP